jgi:hypothetical protein
MAHEICFVNASSWGLGTELSGQYHLKEAAESPLQSVPNVGVTLKTSGGNATWAMASKNWV